MEWEHNGPFCRLSKLLWESDLDLALGERLPGQAAARRRMDCRWQGYEAMTTLVSLQNEAKQLATNVANARGVPS